ncbi:uncharacterized protein F4812DRAFT_466956 [Daldinia caldariorum]|uniref:uncharacterized protein n=1 Tax=Daldinia caldariorum TaxID=326644 RepID=UPI002008921B|nr:uncharacterized protein F4812DRAFT_466956 [Daldinia caldariorum]KAI1464726.1 hypothetical protein F4812DRAFT_466956 [Daldinia caldariorum]
MGVNQSAQQGRERSSHHTHNHMPPSPQRPTELAVDNGGTMAAHDGVNGHILEAKDRVIGNNDIKERHSLEMYGVATGTTASPGGRSLSMDCLPAREFTKEYARGPSISLTETVEQLHQLCLIFPPGNPSGSGYKFPPHKPIVSKIPEHNNHILEDISLQAIRINRTPHQTRSKSLIMTTENRDDVVGEGGEAPPAPTTSIAEQAPTGGDVVMADNTAVVDTAAVDTAAADNGHDDTKEQPVQAPVVKKTRARKRAAEKAADDPSTSKKTKILSFIPSDTDSKKDENYHTSMDRLYNMMRSSKYVALHNVVVGMVEDPEFKKKLTKACKRELEIRLLHKISEDPNAFFLKQRFNEVGEKNIESMFDFTQMTEVRKNLIYTDTYDYQHTDRPRNDRLPASVGCEHDVDQVSLLPVEEDNRVSDTFAVHKWEYLIFSMTNLPNRTNRRLQNYFEEDRDRDRDIIREQATQLPGSFVSREQANAKLDELTRYDNFKVGGTTAAVTRRHVYEHTPSRLLRVELTLNTGEERVLWVERRLVDIQRDLTKKARALKKWAAKRPALPHYIVECEFMTQKTTETPRRGFYGDGKSNSDNDDDNNNNDNDKDNGIDIDAPPAAVFSHEQVGALSGEIELDRLPLATFTERGLANAHAGALFLRHSAVREEIRCALDDFWWTKHAVAIHGEVERRVAVAGGKEEEEEGEGTRLYVAEMYTLDMRARLGFDMIRVAVHKVDDVCGPLNI